MSKYNSHDKPDNRILLRETISISKDNVISKSSLTEKVTEKIDGYDLPIFSTYRIKLWAEKSFNKNGRNYRKVFNKVIQENKTVIGLMDHPEDGEESYRNIVLVGKNHEITFDPETNENWLTAEVTFVGHPYGENCEAVLEAGGPLEFSTSCIGEVDSSGYVLEDGFFYERIDCVINSSNAQLFFKNHDEPRESKPDSDTVLYDAKVKEQKNVTILDKDKENLKEKIMPDKLTERALELNIKSLIRDAEGKETLAEKKELLLTALSYAKDLTESTLASDIENKIKEADNAIHALAEKGKTVDALTTDLTSLTEAKANLEKELETLKAEKATLEENYNNIVTLYENKQYSASQKELLANKKLNGLIESIKEKAKKESKKVQEKANYFEALANTKVDADKIVELNEKLNLALVENQELFSKVEALTKTIKEMRKFSLKNKVMEKSEDKVTAPVARRAIEKIEETRKDRFVNKEVQIYFNNLKEEDESVASMKDAYMKCESLEEAQNLRNGKNKNVSTDDSVSRILRERGLV